MPWLIDHRSPSPVSCQKIIVHSTRVPCQWSLRETTPSHWGYCRWKRPNRCSISESSLGSLMIVILNSFKHASANWIRRVGLDKTSLSTVHNAHYTRNQSLALFSAVLSVSSKFFRPELYEPLLGVAERLVGQAMYACVVAIEVVQAICLLHCASSRDHTDSRLEETGRQFRLAPAGSCYPPGVSA